MKPLLALSLLTALALPSARAETSTHAVDAAPAVPKNLKRGTHETLIYVGDMHCSTCAKKVTGRLFRVKGVKQVRTDVAADLALVTPQANKQLDPLALWDAVEKAGFPPTRLVCPSGEYVRVEGQKTPQKLAAGESAERR